MQKDLAYIAHHVPLWPTGEKFVRLDADGEICFTPKGTDFYVTHDHRHDFPRNPHPAFVPPEKGSVIGREYHKTDWESARAEKEQSQ